MILAPLRGVTIRCFRETFADEIRAAGFTEAITPFITAMKGLDPLKDKELSEQGTGNREQWLKVTPQFIGKDPEALRHCLERVKQAGYETADLNCGCPFPMVRNKGRGSGILRTPDVLRAMLEVGCEVMGPGKFSIKARLGVDRTDELLKLMPIINEFPLRFLTVHARTARQMYEGSCDVEMFEKVEKVAMVPIVLNGDIPFPVPRSRFPDPSRLMIGRPFVRGLGAREDSEKLLAKYLEASLTELGGDRPVLGRMKELIAYWKNIPKWMKAWNVIKICRTTSELLLVLRRSGGAD